MAFAKAVRANDILTAGKLIGKALSQFGKGFSSDATDEVLKLRFEVPPDSLRIQQSEGAQFTGGRSTPVYEIQASVLDRKTGKTQTQNLIFKLVVLLSAKSESVDTSAETEEKNIQFKRVSYVNERRFFDSSIPDNFRELKLKIPNAFLVEGGHSGDFPGFGVVMNDLRKNFPLHPDTLDRAQLGEAMKFAAKMHAYFWRRDLSKLVGTGRDLWAQGGFWTMDKPNSTNLNAKWPETLKYVAKSGISVSDTVKKLGIILEKNAASIGERLQAMQNQTGWTLIHGDYKAANLFFSVSDGENSNDERKLESQSDDHSSLDPDASIGCAAVDFQFTGAGLPAQDLMYLLFPDANANPNLYFLQEAHWIESVYYSHFVEYLQMFGRGGPSSLSVEDLREQFEISRVDLFRHMLSRGWVATSAVDAKLVAKVGVAVERMGLG